MYMSCFLVRLKYLFSKEMQKSTLRKLDCLTYYIHVHTSRPGHTKNWKQIFLVGKNMSLQINTHHII